MFGPESEDSFRQGIKILEGLVADFPQLPVYQEELAEALIGLCGLLDSLNSNGRQAESERIAARSLAIWDKLAAEHPEVPNYLRRPRRGFDIRCLQPDETRSVGGGSPASRASRRQS